MFMDQPNQQDPFYDRAGPDHAPKWETDMQIPSQAVTVATLWFDLTTFWFPVSVSF